MKKVIPKNKQEQIEAEESYFQPHKVKVSDTRNYFWVCDVCRMAYFGDDLITETYDGRMRCPHIVGFFKKKPCGNSLSGGDEKCFNKYYKLSSPS